MLAGSLKAGDSGVRRLGLVGPFDGGGGFLFRASIVVFLVVSVRRSVVHHYILVTTTTTTIILIRVPLFLFLFNSKNQPSQRQGFRGRIETQLVRPRGEFIEPWHTFHSSTIPSDGFLQDDGSAAP
jgi:hypothetical protein